MLLAPAHQSPPPEPCLRLLPPALAEKLWQAGGVGASQGLPLVHAPPAQAGQAGESGLARLAWLCSALLPCLPTTGSCSPCSGQARPMSGQAQLRPALVGGAAGAAQREAVPGWGSARRQCAPEPAKGPSIAVTPAPVPAACFPPFFPARWMWRASPGRWTPRATPSSSSEAATAAASCAAHLRLATAARPAARCQRSFGRGAPGSRAGGRRRGAGGPPGGWAATWPPTPTACKLLPFRASLLSSAAPRVVWSN